MKLLQYAERKVEGILEEMERRYDKDLELSKKKQLACRKLGYLEELSRSLKNVGIWGFRCMSERSSSK